MSKRVSVTDHAALRFLERFRGLDTEALRAEIAAIVQSAVNLGAANYAVDGIVFVLDGATVITIMEGKSMDSARLKGGRRNGKSMRLKR